MITNLRDLRRERLEWVESTRKNNFEFGIKRLLTDLYPDNAHFIYELLQNSEDTHASKVYFRLTKDQLEFSHDGKRLFDLKDIESITSIGASTKRDDATSIGKFGVGFKAVFAYTKTPEINSGSFHLRIHDLVVPEELDNRAKDSAKGLGTRFIFPFNHPEKKPYQASSEIKRTLCALGDNTLLFLNNIRVIEYTLPDGSLGSLERIDLTNNQVEIRAQHPAGNAAASHWLRFQKTVNVKDEDEKEKSCEIAIAYKLVQTQKEKNRKSNASTWQISPLDHGQVSIYFPAEKETSNLRFHIHAPFASTVARDSVRDCDANRQLRDHIADLVVESLTDIRDRGLLTTGFLAVLPNRLDSIPDFYEPIRLAVVTAFKEHDLTPTKCGKHAPAGTLYRGPAKISDVLNDDDLSILTNYETPLWVANATQQNQREDRFLDSLKIDSWGWSELTSALSALDDDARELIEDWISQKDDAWVMRFYALLGEACDVHNESVDAEFLRIVRVGAGQGHEHVFPEEAFLLPEQETTPPRDIRFVKPTVYSTGRSDAQKQFAVSFLEHIGVRPFDARTVIELRLVHYNNLPNQVGDGHYKDMMQFMAYWRKNPADVDLFKEHGFLLGLDAKGKLNWGRPTQICMDRPYLETGLAELHCVHKKLVLWDGYQTKLTKLKNEEFVKFLQAIGVETRLQIVKVLCLNNPEWSYLRSVPGERNTSPINRDYTIQGLEQILKVPSLRISNLIWQTMCNLPRYPDYLKATYQMSERWGSHHSPSQLVHALRQHSWVPQSNGIFVRPADATRELLPEGFPFDAGSAWLKAIEYGIEADKKTKEHQRKEAVVREVGFESLAEAEKWKRIRDVGISPEEVLDQIAPRSRASQPEDSVTNPERRGKGVAERRDNAPTKESVKRERSIQPGAKQETLEAKAYLRAKYTNPQGQLVCQCCHDEMPFKVKDGHYFEAIQCLRGLDRHYFENRLALCPTCAAMYQHARETDDDSLRRSIIEHSAPDTCASAEIPIRLAGRDVQLRFVGTHWFDLKVALKL